MTLIGFCFGKRLILQKEDLGEVTAAIIRSSGSELDLPPFPLAALPMSASAFSVFIGTLKDLLTGKENWLLFARDLVIVAAAVVAVFFCVHANLFLRERKLLEEQNFGGEIEQMFLEKEFLGDMFFGGENMDLSGENCCCLSGMYSGLEGKMRFLVGEYCSRLGSRILRLSWKLRVRFPGLVSSCSDSDGTSCLSGTSCSRCLQDSGLSQLGELDLEKNCSRGNGRSAGDENKSRFAHEIASEEAAVVAKLLSSFRTSFSCT